MKINLPPLQSLLMTNVADVRFLRKRPKAGQPATRRMLCTNSAQLLNSIDGKMALNYKSPKGRKKFNEQRSNVCTTWDIMMQDYRCINTAQCDLITTVPINDFWKYFNDVLVPMSSSDKVAYMNT